MTKKRRRGISSDWILALKQSRTAKILRRNFPSSVSEGTRIRSDTSIPQVEPTTCHVPEPHVPNEIKQFHAPDTTVQRPTHCNHPNNVVSTPRDTEDISHPALDNSSDTDDDDYDPGIDVEYDSDNDEEFQPFVQDGSAVFPILEGHTPAQDDSSRDHLGHQTPPCTGRQMEHYASSATTFHCKSQYHGYECNTEPDMDILYSMRQKWENQLHLSAVLAVVGSVRYTVQHYEYTRNVLLDELSGSGHQWPPYSRTLRYFKEILGTCLPESHVVPLPRKVVRITDRAQYEQVDPELEQTPTTNPENNVRRETECVRIFLPSAWAQLDIATSVVFDSMFNSQMSHTEGIRDIERSRIVTQRRMVTSACEFINVIHGDGSIPCGAGSVVKITVPSPPPRFRTAFNLHDTESMYQLEATTVGTWSVGATGQPTSSLNHLLTQDVLGPRQRTIVQYLSTAPPRPQGPEDGETCNILPGDICTLLNADGECEIDQYQAVAVHSFWRYVEGTPSILLLWILLPEGNDDEAGNATCSAEMGACDIVSSIDLRRYRPPEMYEDHTAPNSHGHLADGTPFFVYRILLYCDDFQKSSQHYPKGSAGGCYFLPLSLPPEARRSTSSVRIVSLTPPGVSTNDFLHHIVDDLVHATVCGVDGHTPDGVPLKIFIDVVGFVGDYPAAAGTVDVIGHVGRAPCTVCTFRRPHALEAEGSRHGYTTTVHAGNSSFLRHAERHLSLRRSGLPTTDANLLGMVDASRADDRSCPLIHLRNELYARQDHIQRTGGGTPVVPGLFDPYRCNAVALDHLLTGLSNDALNTVFQSLPTSTMREHADASICAALRENGLLIQREAFNLNTKTLHSMTLSELYCVILVAAPIMKVLTHPCPSGHVAKEAARLLGKLQLLVAHTYWWQEAGTDGKDVEHMVRQESEGYFQELRVEFKRYVRNVNDFCKMFPEHKGHLDKPNLHRLIELYEHSIPAYGHVREFMDLVFESAHQPLKRCIGDSNHHNSHLFATEHCVGNDWQGRIASLSRELTHENESRRLKARRGFRRLLLGRDADKLDETIHREFITETDNLVQKLLTNAVQKYFTKDGRI